MTEEEMLKNVRMMEGIFPAFIEHYKKVAFKPKVKTWVAAMHSVIDLIAQDSKCPHDYFPEECGLCHDALIEAKRKKDAAPQEPNKQQVGGGTAEGWRNTNAEPAVAAPESKA